MHTQVVIVSCVHVLWTCKWENHYISAFSTHNWYLRVCKLQWLLHRAVLVLVGGGDGGCSWMLLLHSLPTCADAGPDRCTLRLWCYPSINQRKYPTSKNGGATRCNLRWCFFLPPTGAHTPLALKQLALCGGGIYIHQSINIIRTLKSPVLGVVLYIQMWQCTYVLTLY